MPKVSGFRPAFELYGPKLRLQRFPKADWRFLIRAAANTARAFAAVHEARQVIGDVNHGNLVIGQDATVRLIDCDSFKMSSGGRTWFCEVGVPTHQPPDAGPAHLCWFHKDAQPRCVRAGRPNLPNALHGPAPLLGALAGHR